MENYYRIANVILKIQHANDYVFKFMDSELKYYGVGAQEKSDCSISFKPECDEVSVPEKAIRITASGPNYEVYSHGHKLFIIEKGLHYAIAIDSDKKEISVEYREHDFGFRSELRRMLKWLIIKSVELDEIAFIHASAVRFKGKTIIFSGDTQCGKSSSLMRLVNEGAKVISDDTVFYDGAKIIPFSLNTAIDEDFERRFGVRPNSFSIADFRAGETGEKYDGADIIIFLKIWNSSTSEIRQLDFNVALLRLMEIYSREVSSIRWPKGGKDRSLKLVFEKYASFLEKAKCYEFYAGHDEQEVRKSLLDLVNGSHL